MKGHKLFLGKVRFGELGTMEDASTFLLKIFCHMGRKELGDGFNKTDDVLKGEGKQSNRKVKSIFQKA